MAFSPPFCPHSDCPCHRHPPSSRWWHRRGHFTTRLKGMIPRFTCTVCGRSFSTQSFSLDYWTKTRVDMKRIFFSLVSASGLRDMAREQKVSDKVIANRIMRLAHQSVILSTSLRRSRRVREDIVIDGFESFVYSQYFPDNYTIAVGKTSQYLYLMHHAQLNRKGRMSDVQRRRNVIIRQLHPVEPGQIGASFARVLTDMFYYWRYFDKNDPRRVYTDMHKDYERIMKSDPDISEKVESGALIHLTTSSKKARTLSNPLMSVNYFDREIRKDQANHARETLQWAKSVNRSMDRLWVYAAYHNCWKPYRIKTNDERCHAEVAGYERAEIEKLKKGFFTRRYFRIGCDMNESEWNSWHHIWKSPTIEDRLRLPRYALAG